VKPRHAAALALVGWYLLSPIVQRFGRRASGPADAAGYAAKVLGSGRAFDNAQSCNTAQAKMNEKGRQLRVYMESGTGREVLKKYPDGGAQRRAILESEEFAKCVASDDLRLKSN
jgi:hypothetical protein